MWKPISGIVLLLSTLGVAAEPREVEWDHPDVEAWAEELESPSTPEPRRSEILNDLRSAAGGSPALPLTREAMFAWIHYVPADEAGTQTASRDVLRAAAALYPQDPRVLGALERLAHLELSSGDPFGAHYTLTRLFQQRDEIGDPELSVRGALNALTVGDTLSAFDWSYGVNPLSLSEDLRVQAWLVRLTAGQDLGRHTEAIEALERLEESAPDALRGDGRALLAAARVQSATGRLESAIESYRAFVNIHSRAKERAVAMLEHGKLLTRLQRIDPATRVFDWLVEQYPETTESDLARVARVDLNLELAPLERAEAYRLAATEARTHAGADEACRRLLETLLAEGHPLEAVSILGWMVGHAEGFAALAARQSLIRGMEPAMKLMASREDPVELAAAAAAIDSLGLPIPRGSRLPVLEARQQLGLGSADRSLERVRKLARAGEWKQVEQALALIADSTVLDGESRAELARLGAEALWREGQEEQAVKKIDGMLAFTELTREARRRLVMLRADIRFATGHVEEACADYRAAAGTRETPRTSRQLAFCTETANSREIES